MANTTQCPHCFTTYVISDEQYRASGGNVRCGTCRERFQVEFIEDKGAPRIDPDDLSIEPLSQMSVQEVEQETDKTITEKPADEPIEFAAGQKSKDKPEPGDEETKQQQLKMPESIVFATEEATESPTEPNIPEQAELDISIDEEPDQPAPQPSRKNSGTKQPPPKSGAAKKTKPSRQSDAALIEEVDQLIEDKLVGDSISVSLDVSEEMAARIQRRQARKAPILERSSNISTRTGQEPFSLQPKRSSTIQRWLFAPVTLVIALILSGVLLYQLWLRQALPWLDDERVTSVVTPVILPMREQLTEQLDVELPVRRDLRNLRLLSARTESHPTRSSMLLLRVSMVNKSSIAQPFPWLELSLTDESGRLISRRALRPEDYLYNNRVANRIGPQELKRVTIELLAFPEQVKGYELKLLNK